MATDLALVLIGEEDGDFEISPGIRTRFGVRMMSDTLKGNLKAIGRVLELGEQKRVTAWRGVLARVWGFIYQASAVPLAGPVDPEAKSGRDGNERRVVNLKKVG